MGQARGGGWAPWMLDLGQLGSCGEGLQERQVAGPHGVSADSKLPGGWRTGQMGTRAASGAAGRAEHRPMQHCTHSSVPVSWALWPAPP